MNAFAVRSTESEILDDPATPAAEIEASLRFMVGINRWFGGSRVVLDFLQQFKSLKSFTVLDLGTGSGDIPNAIVLWARAQGIAVRITALDINPICLAFAERHFGAPEIEHVRRSAFEIDQMGPFDFVTSSMFFHHLSDAQIVELLQKMHRVATRGFIVNDLYRNPLAYAGAGLLGLASLRHIVINDAMLSVKRAFREADCERFRQQAGLPNMKIERRPLFRIAMSECK